MEGQEEPQSELEKLIRRSNSTASLTRHQHISPHSGRRRRKTSFVVVGELYMPPCTSCPPSFSLCDRNDSLVCVVFLRPLTRIRP
ncbi:hypothetical protein SESBI_12952 [Sesbania bispinosa]|nr:hypothetical protein SESBI_12952 [Sesbania bispinosa]